MSALEDPETMAARLHTDSQVPEMDSLIRQMLAIAIRERDAQWIAALQEMMTAARGKMMEDMMGSNQVDISRLRCLCNEYRNKCTAYAEYSELDGYASEEWRRLREARNSAEVALIACVLQLCSPAEDGNP